MGILTFIAVLVVGGQIAKAIAQRNAGPQLPGGRDLRETLDQLDHRLEELEHHLAETNDRLADMDERMDFAERMLTQQKAREQLGP